MSDSLWPHGLYGPWNSPGQNIGVGSLSLLQGNLHNPGIEPRSPALQADSLPAEPQGKPKNSGVGSLSLLQWIFPTQELNQGLLHCRWILYQLNYQEADVICVSEVIDISPGNLDSSLISILISAGFQLAWNALLFFELILTCPWTISSLSLLQGKLS